jgi:hypothetical protein
MRLHSTAAIVSNASAQACVSVHPRGRSGDPGDQLSLILLVLHKDAANKATLLFFQSQVEAGGFQRPSSFLKLVRRTLRLDHYSPRGTRNKIGPVAQAPESCRFLPTLS